MAEFEDIGAQILVEKGLLSDADARESLEQGGLEALLDAASSDESSLATWLAEEFGLEVRSLADRHFPPEILPGLTAEKARQMGVLPVERRDGAVLAALYDPGRLEVLDSLSRETGEFWEACIVTRSEFESTVDRWLGDVSLHQLAQGAGEAVAKERIPEPEAQDEGAIEAYVQLLIKEALKRRASDIHLEPMGTRFRLRYRIDGVLHAMEDLPKRLQAAILSRIKLMAHMSIAEKRLTQDGRIRAVFPDKTVDLRVSSIPSVHGESIVMRILDQESLKLGLEQLGFGEGHERTFRRLVSLPDGIILVTGPTGSGKSTTLYACLNFLNQPDRKIITVEDPVEYQLSGINQVQVLPEVGMSFAAGLRAMLRQAPNVIMVGEIRDQETAEIAVNASQTGHLVLSTLHTNDAPSAVTRLMDLGVPPFLIASSLRASMAQRLVRRVCPECGEPHALEPHHRTLLEQMGLQEEVAGAVLMQGRGCASCRDTGYRGRLGIFEIMEMLPDIEEAVYRSAPHSELRRLALSYGMRSLREDGLRKAIAGISTLDEVLSVTL